MTVCERCRKGWQEGAGAQIVVEDAAVERALCDAQHIGSIDGAAPQRAYQDLAPSVERFVWRRDGGRCRVDGCRSARGIEIHHIVHRADGGTHEPWNLCLLCSSCHAAHHRGALSIAGTAEALQIHRPGQRAPVVDIPAAAGTPNLGRSRISGNHGVAVDALSYRVDRPDGGSSISGELGVIAGAARARQSSSPVLLIHLNLRNGA